MKFVWLYFAAYAQAVAATDIIIVGAGAAGLSAARRILQRDSTVNIRILEATDRHGGRIYSRTVGSTRVDMGAEEHYGERGGNPVYPAVTDYYGTGIYDVPSGPRAYSMDNGASTCSTLASSNLLDCGDDADVSTFFGVWDWYWKPSAFKDPTTTVKDELETARKFKVTESNRAYHLYESEFAAEFGTNLRFLGARGLAQQEFEWSLSENYFLVNSKDVSYQDALDTVWWDALLADAQVTLQLDSPVTAVSSDANGVVVTAGGTDYTADYAIVTASIGVLQTSSGDEGYINFTPPLPQSTQTAINSIGISPGMKVVMNFSNAWWETAAGSALSDFVTEGPAGWCWPLDYKSDSPDHIIMCFMMGDNAETLSGLSTDDDIIIAVLGDLDAMFPQANPSALSSYVANSGFVQDWGAHPYTRGAYSFPTTSTIDDDGDALTGNARERLQQPVGNGRVFFAGEGLHLTASATLPGAVLDGERAANAIPGLDGPTTTTTTTTTTTSATTSGTGSTTTPPCVGGGISCSGACKECCNGSSSAPGGIKTCNFSAAQIDYMYGTKAGKFFP